MTSGLGPGRFIGRQRELEQLDAAVTDVAAGRGGALLVAGSSGMGASRLLDELESRIVGASGQPLTHLRSDRLPAWRRDPYRPIRAARSSCSSRTSIRSTRRRATSWPSWPEPPVTCRS